MEPDSIDCFNTRWKYSVETIIEQAHYNYGNKENEKLNLLCGRGQKVTDPYQWKAELPKVACKSQARGFGFLCF